MINYNDSIAFLFLSELFADIYSWLASKTPGGYSRISEFKYYDENVWSIIKNKIIELDNKKYLTLIEKEFLKCKYVGDVFRVLDYNAKRKGHVLPIKYHQSCSKDMDGITNVNLYGKKLLVKLFANDEIFGIDIFELLCFMIKYKIIIVDDRVKSLLRYEDEKEVVLPVCDKTIVGIDIINNENEIIGLLPREMWYRKSMR